MYMCEAYVPECLLSFFSFAVSFISFTWHFPLHPQSLWHTHPAPSVPVACSVRLPVNIGAAWLLGSMSRAPTMDVSHIADLSLLWPCAGQHLSALPGAEPL